MKDIHGWQFPHDKYWDEVIFNSSKQTKWNFKVTKISDIYTYNLEFGNILKFLHLHQLVIVSEAGGRGLGGLSPSNWGISCISGSTY